MSWWSSAWSWASGWLWAAGWTWPTTWTWLLAVLFSVSIIESAEKAPVSKPEPTEESTPSEDVEECQKGVKGLKKDVLGLEFYLQDKKDYKSRCPETKWKQPKLEEYKKEPKSYLPKECKGKKS